MKGVFICAAAVIVAAYGAIDWPRPDRLQLAARDAGEPSRHYRLVSRKIGLNCGVAAGVTDEQGRRPLVIDADCSRNARLAGVRWWLDRADGTIAFAAQEGRIVAEFAVADGAAYETYARDKPIMTLIASD